MNILDRLDRRAAPLLIAGLVLTGCGYQGASSLPLPGAISGPDTYPVTMVLPDATNLVAKETCRSNDTVIGSVESVTLDKDLQARIVCRIRNSVHLPANVNATLSETSLLGERFVALDVPVGQSPRGQLASGTTLPAATTRVDPDVEMVFGALSQVLNGGSLGSIDTITRELTTALHGSDFSGTLHSLDSVVATLNVHRGDITASLDSLNRLSGTLARQRAVLARALDSIPGGLAVLDRQRTRLVATLSRLSDLSRTAVPLIRATRANTVADLTHLAPVLSQLSKAGDQLALTFGRIATFPFPSNALSTVRGDFAGMYANVDVDIDLLNRLLGGPSVPAASTPAPRSTGTATNPGLPGVLSGLLGSLTQSGSGSGGSGGSGLGSLLGGILGGRS